MIQALQYPNSSIHFADKECLDPNETIVTIKEEMNLNMDKKLVHQKTDISKGKEKAGYAKKSDTDVETGDFDELKVPSGKYFIEENDFERPSWRHPSHGFLLQVGLLNLILLLKIQ